MNWFRLLLWTATVQENERVISLLAEYREAADVMDELADSDAHNQAARQIHACYKALRETEDGRPGIIALMSDTSPHVRAWAASHSLQWNPDAAERVLEGMALELL